MARSTPSVTEALLANVARHGTLLPADETTLRKLPYRIKALQPEQDVVRQGDRPEVAVFVVKGMLARYHTLPDGNRQYVALHVAGDMPDIHSLFIQEMDHAVCALDAAEIALFPHDAVRTALLKRPALAFAFWRMTLIDAAIFRQAITNNSARPPAVRLAHLFCEQVTRARQLGLITGSCSLPLNQQQLGQLLGMSHISVNRALQQLRKLKLAELHRGRLDIGDWSALTQFAGFDPTYLHLTKDSETARTPFKGRRKADR